LLFLVPLLLEAQQISRPGAWSSSRCLQASYWLVPF